MTKKNVKTKIRWRYRHPWFLRIFFSGVILFFTAISFGTYYIHQVIQDVPTVTKKELQSESSSNMYAADGTLIWSSAENKRDYIPFDKIPKTYIDLLLCTEDATFYQDPGFSPKGLAAAILSTIKAKFGHGEVRGGSSIEQQLIKLSVFSTDIKDRTLERKIKEFFLANQLYQNYSKNQILEFYINKIYLGQGCYGAQTIAKAYFDKPLDQLTLSQQAIVAGLGQAPSAYDLYQNPDLVKQRRDMVLKSAYEQHKISKTSYQEALKASVIDGLKPQYWQNKELMMRIIEHNAFITSALDQIKELGYDLNVVPLQIYTTLDRKINTQLKSIVDTRNDLFQSDNEQTAVTISSVSDGHVLAQIGGRKVNEPYAYNRATAKTRSTGSSAKPIIAYGPALEYLNWPTNHLLDSSPYTYKGTNLTATNYGGASYGMVTMKEAIQKSHNTPAIRALSTVGPTKADYFLKNVGIQLNESPEESQAIGFNASTAQMANAYAVFANGGTYHPVQYIQKLTFPDGSQKEIQLPSKKVMRESTAFIMTQMLKQVVSEQGTLPDAIIPDIPYAAKTGTVGYPQNSNVPEYTAMDLWVVGYTTSLSIALWEGTDEPMAPNGWLYEGPKSPNGHQLWRTLMDTFGRQKEHRDWTPPSTIQFLDNQNMAPSDETSVVFTQPTPLYDLPNSSLYNPLMKNLESTIKITVDDESFEKIPDNYQPKEWKKELEEQKRKDGYDG